jgi:hypothetical protein
MKNVKALIVIIAGICSLTACAEACGPFFDNAYFIRSSEKKYAAIPEGDFLFECKRIAGDGPPMTITPGAVKRSAAADIEDLKRSLAYRTIAGKDFDDAVASYQKARDEINAFLESCPVEDPETWYGGRFRSQERIKSEVGKGDKLTLTVELPAPQQNAPAADGEVKRESKSFTGPSLALTPAVPEEFRIYLQGALKYHFNDFNGAIEEWKKILALPEAERSSKSTWASFMIGKAYLSMRDPERAITCFEDTRATAEKGFADPLNLSMESYGWQALAEYEMKDYVSSIRHYLKRMDVNSLNRICSKASESKDGSIGTIVKDDTARSVLLGWAVSRPFWNAMEWTADETYRDFFDRLLSAIEALGTTGPVDYADRVAWLYYTKGDADAAKRWLALARSSTPLAQFIDFKITLRGGNVDEAIQKLSVVMKSFEQGRDKEIFFQEDVHRLLNSDMAVLQLSRKEYIAAFDLLLRGKFWEDIAYVAEKVLTVKELEDCVRAERNKDVLEKRKKFYEGYIMYAQNRVKTHPDETEWYADNLKEEGQTLGEALEYLLARRLARQGEWDRAAQLLPTKIRIDRSYVQKKGPSGEEEYTEAYEEFNPREKLTLLAGSIRKAQDEKAAKRDRAKAYYDAGIIMRKYGMELAGTELDPDGFVDRGAYPYYGSLENRFGILSDEAKADYAQWNQEGIAKTQRLRDLIKKDRGYFYGSEDEEGRVTSSLPSPNKRFHYRYRAADLMWKCAQLLPDNDDLKAKALCLGGIFVKDRDTKYADTFYQELVRKCGKTELGKRAEKLKWFPDVPY